ncbi:hypothetical protein [Variovorax sp. LT1R16]|uniref:hypothetical protein n=1 Tax=Variovorax sp. LT1R16 TaxID=3443728 RepID=UPI003F464D7C
MTYPQIFALFTLAVLVLANYWLRRRHFRSIAAQITERVDASQSALSDLPKWNR